MKKLLLAGLIAVASMTLFSCSPYGDKVKINEHLEVYVTKEATKEEGKKLGEYIATLDTSNANQKSIQLQKENDVYSVRLVVPDEHIANKELEESFQALQYLIKENVFPGKTVKLILTDDEFKGKHTVTEISSLDETEPAETEMPVDSTSGN